MVDDRLWEFFRSDARFPAGAFLLRIAKYRSSKRIEPRVLSPLFSVARRQEWTEQLFVLGHSLYLRHLSNLKMMEKLHSRIIEGVVQTIRDEPKIVVKE